MQKQHLKEISWQSTELLQRWRNKTSDEPAHPNGHPPSPRISWDIHWTHQPRKKNQKTWRDSTISSNPNSQQSSFSSQPDIEKLASSNDTSNPSSLETKPANTALIEEMFITNQQSQQVPNDIHRHTITGISKSIENQMADSLV